MVDGGGRILRNQGRSQQPFGHAFEMPVPDFATLGQDLARDPPSLQRFASTVVAVGEPQANHDLVKGSADCSNHATASASSAIPAAASPFLTKPCPRAA